MQTMPPLQLRIGVYVHQGHRRQHFAPAQRGQFGPHLVAQLTVLPMHYCEAHA